MEPICKERPCFRRLTIEAQSKGESIMWHLRRSILVLMIGLTVFYYNIERLFNEVNAAVTRWPPPFAMKTVAC